MEEDYSSTTFNSYNKGPGRLLKPKGGIQSNSRDSSITANNYSLFIDHIPVTLTKVNILFNKKCSQCIYIYIEICIITSAFVEQLDILL